MPRAVRRLSACRRLGFVVRRLPWQGAGNHASCGSACRKRDTPFLDLSQALTGQNDLDPITAHRIEQAFASLRSALHAQFPALVALAARTSDAQPLVAAAGEARTATLAITTAWYTGTVSRGVHAVTVSYRDALMQRCVDEASTRRPTCRAALPGGPPSRRPRLEPAPEPALLFLLDLELIP